MESLENIKQALKVLFKIKRIMVNDCLLIY